MFKKNRNSLKMDFIFVLEGVLPPLPRIPAAQDCGVHLMPYFFILTSSTQRLFAFKVSEIKECERDKLDSAIFATGF